MRNCSFDVVKGGALPVRLFMKLFIGFILSLRGEENASKLHDMLVSIINP